MFLAVIAASLLALQDHSTAGAKALEDGKYEEAVAHFSKAVAADPKDYYSHFHLALAHSALHKDAEAVEHYRKTLELSPKLYEAELNLGIILVDNRRAVEAVAMLEDASSQKPAEFRPAYYLAEAYLAAERFANAESAFRNALKLDPKSAPAAYGLARALTGLKKFAEAREAFVKAGVLEPQYRYAVLELAGLHEEQNRQDEAIAIYREFPQTAAAQERLGALLLKRGAAAEAVGPLEVAVAKSATAGNRFALAKAYLQSDQPLKALPLVEQVIAAEPKEAELWMMRGRIQRDHQKKFTDAANSFFTAAKLRPTNPEAWTEMAGVLVLTDEPATAMAALDKVRELKAETAGHYFLRAIVLDKNKQLKPALEEYRRFLAASDGKNPDREFQARQRAKIIEKELSRK